MKGDEFRTSFMKVFKFDSVCNFLETYIYLKPASELSCKQSYHIFKDDIYPMIEDDFFVRL